MANIVEKAEDYISSAKIDVSVLRDQLSEFLAVERGGVMLYERALEIVVDAEVRRQFNEFLAQTRKHETILLRVISALGLDPTYMSAGAKLADKKARSLLATMTDVDGLSSRAMELNAIENIVLAETKDQADWELLGKIARQADEERIREVLRPAVAEVEPEEDDHLSCAQKELARLAFAASAKKA
jgi:rubrerythrin